jgi:uncharacterized RDD family membrane protein YckC
VRIGRIPLGPVRGVLADETERAIDAALAGPLPEMVGRAIVEQRVLERVIGEMLDASAGREAAPDEAGADGVVEQVLRNPALERWVASEEATRLAEAATQRLVHTPAFQRAVAEMLSSPEVRKALAEAAGGYGEEAADAARGKARVADDRIEARVHRLVRRPRPAEAGFGGVATRGVALVVDAALAQAAYLIVAASVTLVLGLVGELHGGWLTGSLAGGGWLLVVALYFVGFWSVTGQTPGMRLMKLRVQTRSGEPPSAPRSLVRLAGLFLAIILLFAGFLPALFDRRRRALPDFVAGTTVGYEPVRPVGMQP